MNAAPSNQVTLALEMRGVTVSAMREPGAVVAEEVNWTVAPGEFWVIAGPQRSGKSDFLMLAGGLMAPARGSYRFFGEAMPIFEDARLAQRLRLGFVFDGGQLFKHLTLAENIALPLRYHQNLAGADAQPRVEALLELTQLTPWATSTPAEVGRSWQKRAGLARALALRPDMLLLDNPLGGLDARHTAWWLNFLDELSRGHTAFDAKPRTLVATADDLRPWKSDARRFGVLRDRRFSALGGWAEVNEADESLVKDLLAETGA